jgi:hypothetical protein
MAYYNYKRVLDLIPDDFRVSFEATWRKEFGEYEETCDYDGSLWILAADYISDLQERLKAAENQIASIRDCNKPG